MSASILLITNDSETQHAVREVAQRAMLNLTIAETTRAAANVMRAGQRPQVLLIDLTIGDLETLDFIRHLRTRPTFNEMQIIALTAFPDPRLIKTALQTGANRYLTRMFIQKNLLPMLQVMIPTMDGAHPAPLAHTTSGLLPATQ